MAGGTGRLLRAALIYLAANFTAIGLWATVASRNFYDNFPGGGHRWLAGDGPYSAPLVSDAGVGFLAVGAVLVLAALWRDRRVVQTALLAVIVHDLPHLLFHLRHPNASLGQADHALSVGGLAIGTIIAAAALIVVTARPDGRLGATASESAAV